jgi:hypothetical protein
MTDAASGVDKGLLGKQQQQQSQHNGLLVGLKEMVVGGKNALVEPGSGCVYGLPKGKNVLCSCVQCYVRLCSVMVVECGGYHCSVHC